MREEIRKRIDMIRRGEVPEGYKKTKVGIVPEEWEVKQIKDCLKRIENPVEVIAEREYTQIGIRSHGKGIFYKEPVTGAALGNKKVYWIEQDCFIVNIVFSWEQAVAKTTDKEKGMIGSHRFPMYKPINNEMDLDWLCYYFLSQPGIDLMEFASPGGAGRNRTLGQDRFMKSFIYAPPKQEQAAIAKVMNLITRQVEAQEALIEQKQNQKKWLMQNLLTGKKRIDGFDGEWQEVKLREVLIERKEYATKQDEYIHASLTKEGVCAKTERYNRDFLVRDENKKYKITRKKDICYNPANLKFGVICINTFGTAIFSPIYVTYEVDEAVDAEYIAQYLCRQDFINAVRKYEEGTVYERMSVSSDDFLRYKIRMPQLQEQQAIAAVLSTADKEIQLLQQQLELYKQEKKAIMQLLLTGIVRVNELSVGRNVDENDRH